MVKVTRLTRKFGATRAVDDMSFAVEPGEVLGFLGPNGAGKSTTMKILTGFITPTAGTVEVCGIDVLRLPIAAKKLIGYLPEGAPAWSDMTVKAFLRFMGEVRGLRGRQLRERVDAVADLVQISPRLNQPIDTLSKGFRRRVVLGQALIHDPQVLILDEPTDGLDPNQKHQVRELIDNLSSDKIVIISTHILEEVQAVCTRALIIAQGRIVADGRPDELARLSRYHQAVHVRFVEPCARPGDFEDLPGVAEVEMEADGLGMTIFPEQGESVLAVVNHLIHSRDWPVEEFHIEQGRLDDVFRKLTRGAEA